MPGFEVLTRATAGPAGRDIPFIRFLSAPGEKFRAFPDTVPSIRAAAASERIRVADGWIFLRRVRTDLWISFARNDNQL